MRMMTDRMPPITPGEDREPQVHRADVLVVGGIDVTLPAGRMAVVVMSGCCVCHSDLPLPNYCCASLALASSLAVMNLWASSSARGLRLLGPGVIIGLLHHHHLDRHERMVLAAEFRALAVEHACPRGLEPVLVEAARNGVDLHAEGRDRPGMDDAVGIGRDDQLHRLVDRHINRRVGLQEVGDVGGMRRLDVAGLVVQRGGEGHLGGAVLVEAEVGIFIGPVPARVADHLDRHVGGRNVALQVEQAEGRDGDDHQDQDRDHRPGHFDRRVVRGARGNRVRLGVELHHHIDRAAPERTA